VSAAQPKSGTEPDALCNTHPHMICHAAQPTTLCRPPHCVGAAPRTSQCPPPCDLPRCAAHRTAQTATLGSPMQSPMQSPSHESAAQVFDGTAGATRAHPYSTRGQPEYVRAQPDAPAQATRAQPKLAKVQPEPQGRSLSYEIAARVCEGNI